MKAVNIAIPPSLNVLSPDELKVVALNAIQGRVGRDVLTEVLSDRLDTKRKINNAVASISANELSSFYLELDDAKTTIDFNRTFFLLAEVYRRVITVKQ